MGNASTTIAVQKIAQTSSADPRLSLSSTARSGPTIGVDIVWVRLAIACGFLVIAFWPILRGIYLSWFDPYTYMEHGILVIPAAGYMTWSKRRELRTVEPQPSRWGVVLLAFGALQATFATAAHWIWVSRMAFLVSLSGCILALLGFRMLRVLAYPLCTLILMIAPPTFLFERLTLSLQLLASRLGEFSLDALGYSVLREGNILELVGVKLSVAEACSGIRSLLGILFISVLYNFLFVRESMLRWIVLIAAVPIAILGNAARIVATGIASQHNPQLVYGTAHEAFGWVSITLAGLGCAVVHVLAVTVRKAWRARHG